MSDIVDFIAQGDTDLRPALERAVAEIERLKAAFDFVRRGVVTYSVVELDEHFRNARTALEGKS